MKEAGMRIRIESELREAFVTACRGQDLPAAQVLRGFMKEYVRKFERTSLADTPSTEGVAMPVKKPKVVRTASRQPT